MQARRDYLLDLLDDCVEAAREAGVPKEQEGSVVAALILSDSLNGLRKAILQTNGISARRMLRDDVEGRV